MNRLQVARVAAGVTALVAALLTVATLGLPGVASAAGSTPGPSTLQQLDRGQASGSARDFITFGLQPAYPAGAPPRPTFALVGDSGTQQRDNLRVSNFSQKPVTLRIYAADARTAPDGGFEIAGSTTKPKDVGSWVRFLFLHNGFLTLPGRSRIDLPFVVAVPRGAEPGDHAGALVAAVTIPSRDKSGALVNVESRVASRLYLRVGGTLHPRLEVTNLHASYAGVLNPVGQGRVTVSYTVRNTGNVRMAVEQAVRLTPQFWGPEVDVPLRAIPEIVPGASVVVTATASKVWPLVRYTAGVHLTPQPVRDAIAANTLNAHAASRQVQFWAIPWVLVALIALLMLGLVAVRWGRRRYRRRHPVGRHAKVGGPPAAPKRAKQKVPALTRCAPAPVGVVRAALAVLAVALLSLGGAATAQAGGSADGLLTFTPAKGKDTTPMYFVTSKPCPAQATNVLATAYGHGFTANGQIVVSNSTSGMSHTSPFALPLQDTMAAYAKRLNISLAGPYKVVLICKSRLGMTPFATMVGTITFHTPHDYTAPAVTPSQVAAVTGQPGAQADGQLPSTGALTAPGSTATSGPSTAATAPSGGTPQRLAPIPARGQSGIPASPGSGSTASAGASAPAMTPTSATRTQSGAMWWLSVAGVLLLVVGVALALRSAQAPASTSQAGTTTPTEPAFDPSPERVP